MPFTKLTNEKLEFLKNPTKEVIEKVVFTKEEMDEYPTLSETDIARISEGFKSNQGISGKIFVEVTITTDGKTTNPEIISGENKSLYDEAIQIALNLENANPGRIKGQYVSGRIIIPIKFK